MSDPTDTSDEMELDRIFEEARYKKLSKAVKRAKWRSILRIVVVTFLAVGIIAGSSFFIGQELTTSRRVAMGIAVDNYYSIAHPNQHIGKITRYEGFFSGTIIYSTYKIIEGRVVYTGQQDYSYGLIESNSIQGVEFPDILGASDDEKGIETTRYNEWGQREMVFFYPFIDYPIYRDDLKQLPKIDRDKYVEMALSFDQAYSLADAEKLIPKGITVTWYWIDDLSQEEKNSAKRGGNRPAQVRSERNIYGIKVYDKNGQPMKQPEENFIRSLKNGYEQRESLKGTTYTPSFLKQEFARVYHNLADADGKLTKENIQVQGVVVTGNPESLQLLRDLPFIKASSLGVVTEQY